MLVSSYLGPKVQQCRTGRRQADTAYGIRGVLCGMGPRIERISELDCLMIDEVTIVALHSRAKWIGRSIKPSQSRLIFCNLYPTDSTYPTLRGILLSWLLEGMNSLILPLPFSGILSNHVSSCGRSDFVLYHPSIYHFIALLVLLDLLLLNPILSHSTRSTGLFPFCLQPRRIRSIRQPYELLFLPLQPIALM